MTKNSKLSGWPELFTQGMSGFANPFGAPATAAPESGSSMLGGIELLQSMWGAAAPGVPGFVLPTLDLAEIDKRIKDLRAVESWLELNANMLKATIQGLEVQRNTVAALQALQGQGDWMKQFQPGAAAAADASSAQDAKPAAYHAQPGWPMSAASSDQAHAQDADPELALNSHPEPDEPDEPDPQTADQKRRRRTGAAAQTGKSSSAPAGLTLDQAALHSAGAQSASLWMNFLQEQFSRIAKAAVAPQAAAPSATAKTAASGTPPTAKQSARRAHVVAKKTAPSPRARGSKGVSKGVSKTLRGQSASGKTGTKKR